MGGVRLKRLVSPSEEAAVGGPVVRAQGSKGKQVTGCRRACRQPFEMKGSGTSQGGAYLKRCDVLCSIAGEARGEAPGQEGRAMGQARRSPFF